MNRKVIYLAMFVLLCGCAGSPLQTGVQAERNRMQMGDVKIGMNFNQVRRIMGSPHKREKRTINGKEYEVWYYITKEVLLFQSRYLNSNFTPFIFLDDNLQGWGWKLFNSIFEEEPTRYMKDYPSGSYEKDQKPFEKSLENIIEDQELKNPEPENLNPEQILAPEVKKPATSEPQVKEQVIPKPSAEEPKIEIPKESTTPEAVQPQPQIQKETSLKGTSNGEKLEAQELLPIKQTAKTPSIVKEPEKNCKEQSSETKSLPSIEKDEKKEKSVNEKTSKKPTEKLSPSCKEKKEENGNYNWWE